MVNERATNVRPGYVPFWLKRVRVLSLVRRYAVYLGFALTHHALLSLVPV